MVRERERKRGDLKHLSVHQWLRSAIPDSQQPISPIGFLFLKLPPPPCAVLLVIMNNYRNNNDNILELTLIVGSVGLLDPRCHCMVGLKAIEWGPAASEIYSLCFFEHIHGIIDGTAFFFLEQWGRLVPESSCEGFFLKNLLPISTFHFV